MVVLDPLLPCSEKCNELYDIYHDALTKDFTTPNALPAVLFLDDFEDVEDYIKKISFNKRYGYKKAKRLGYFVEPFYVQSFIGDIVAINISKDIRAGGLMRGEYLKTVEERGGYLKEFKLPPEIKCYKHFIQTWGVFKHQEGWKQGEVVVNKRLYAYIAIIVMGEYAIYSMIIGHGKYLKDEIMTIIHIELVKYFKEKTFAKYLEYHTYTSGTQGLQDWKRYFLFKPTHLSWK